MFELAKAALIFFALNIQFLYVGHVFLTSKNLLNIFFKSSLSNIFLSYLIGLTFNIMILILLGSTSCLYASFYLSIILLFFACTYQSIKQFLKFIFGNHTAFIFVAMLLAFCIISAYHIPGHWDDTMYHLPLVRYYAENHNFTCANFIRFPLMPQNIEVIYCIPALFYGTNNLIFEYSSQMLSTLLLILTFLGLSSASELYTNNIVYGCIMMLVLFANGIIRSIFGYAYIDYGLMLFSWGTVFCLMSYFDAEALHFNDEKYKILLLAGVFSGITIGTKLFGLVFIFLCLLTLSYFIKGHRRELIPYCLLMCLFGSFWYIRSFLISGDPFHPAGGNIFGFYIWDKQDLIMQIAEQGTHGVKKNLLYLIPCLWKIDSLYMLLLGYIPLIWSKISKGIRFSFVVFILYFLFWFFVTQVDRYIFPIFPITCFLLGYILYYIKDKKLNKSTLFVKKFNIFFNAKKILLLSFIVMSALCIHCTDFTKQLPCGSELFLL